MGCGFGKNVKEYDYYDINKDKKKQNHPAGKKDKYHKYEVNNDNDDDEPFVSTSPVMNILGIPMTKGQSATVAADYDVGNVEHFPRPRSAPAIRSKEYRVEGAPQRTSAPSSPAIRSSVDANKPFPVLFIGTYNYSARCEDELTFYEGDKLQIYGSVHANWLKAKLIDQLNGKVGYAPASHIARIDSIEANPWHFILTSRSDAERALMNPKNNVGAFLVRPVNMAHSCYVVSVRVPFKVSHFLVHGSPKSGSVYLTHKKRFNSIEEMIRFHQKEKFLPIPQLKYPCFKLEAPQTPGLAHSLEATWEIPRSTIQLQTKLGEGNFGEVYEALWNGAIKVAVKKLKKDEVVEKEFMQEVEVMKKLIHPKVVQLYGISTSQHPYYIVTELLKNGDLLSYLRKGNGSTLPEEKLIDICSQIANGMHYLESKNFIHRDLAARNILVGELDTCKIADFGLARFTQGKDYILDKNMQLPLKWCAPETLKYKQFTIKSDVWSFGIVLVEVIEKGMVPYPAMDNTEVHQQVIKGYKMPRSLMPHCPEKLYEIMNRCWEYKPQQRPSFHMLVALLEKFYDEESGYSAVDVVLYKAFVEQDLF